MEVNGLNLCNSFTVGDFEDLIDRVRMYCTVERVLCTGFPVKRLYCRKLRPVLRTVQHWTY